MLITAIGRHVDSVEEPVMVVTAVTENNASIYYQVNRIDTTIVLTSTVT